MSSPFISELVSVPVFKALQVMVNIGVLTISNQPLEHHMDIWNMLQNSLSDVIVL